MAKLLSEFNKIDGLNGVFTAEKSGLRCSAVRLKTGGLCLFSPVLGLGKEAIASLADLGKVAFLLAPNHYHNKGLLEYRKAFPKASICARPEAHARLAKITGCKFQDVDVLRAALPNAINLIFPQGLKTGEIWIKAKGDQHRAWLVADAFSGPKGKPDTVASTPDMLGTFPKYGVSDRNDYLAWVAQKIRADKPTMIVPCHGSLVRSSKLAKSLLDLVQSRL